MSGYNFDVVKAAFNIRDEVIRVLGEPISACHRYNKHACPFVAEKTPGEFTVYEDHYHCFSCGETGDVIDFFAWVNNKSISEIMRENNLDFTPEQLIERKEEIVKIKIEAREKANAEVMDALKKLHRTKKWIEYHNNLNETYRELWRRRGVEDAFQSIWQLGYNPAFKYRTNQGILTTPSLTIPIKAVGGECLNIQHRLQNAINGERYRPEGMGLKMDNPFICDTELKGAQDIIIVEGAIKAMVTYQTYDKPGAQVIGALNKGMMDKTIRQSKGRNAIVIPDPDGREEIQDAARCSGAKVLRLPKKIDDLILEHGLGKHWLRDTIQQARII